MRLTADYITGSIAEFSPHSLKIPIPSNYE
jgi:hypothetical protein